MGIKRKKRGFCADQQFLACDIEMRGSRSQQNETATQSCDEFHNDSPEINCLALHREDDWNCIRRPGADLSSAWQSDLCALRL
jgi:hypothetical protein